ncbi:4-(cytidine 5'-diphospho)-2-C-methyl-D-erythritol kinase [Parvibaculum sp.]|jgi:4-diphosphocytidyl-2-C-methyl-D-erythritol kinase|uniref:4-(cytidine 5'-diphospho)-2-C-methyl-D-erythritol kinase n=1 Tax=Parvibaculum sp. TaxID=2024848 RepID=UPI00391A9D2E
MAAPERESAFAKINLSLRISGRRPDGYHELRSLAVFAAIGDRIEVHPSAQLTLDLEGRFASSLAGEADNLVLRAARGLRDLCGIGEGARILLEKNLPVASGIGGGSADAAAALRALMRLWRVKPDEAGLMRLAASLGADVPVCLGTAPALMSGIGEKIRRLPRLPEIWLLLANPGVALSTADVFRALAAPPLAAAPAAAHLPDFATLDDLVEWLQGEPNDLERPARALLPLIGEVIGAIAATPGCRLARMSGSGATCFGIYASASEAQSAAAALSAAHPGWWIAAAPAVSGSG